MIHRTILNSTWSPLMVDLDKSDLIHRKLDEIASYLYSLPEETESCGLLGGTAGHALFFTYYYELTKDEKYLHKTCRILSSIFDYLSRNPGYYSFASGITGIGWLIEHIKEKGVIEIDTEDSLDIFDQYLSSVLRVTMLEGNYDFLHGALGVGLYFLKRATPASRTYVEELLLLLDKAKIQDASGFKWKTYNKDGEFNFGLAHGIPSITAICSKAFASEISTGICSSLIEGSINFLLSNTFDLKVANSAFPYYLQEGEEPTTTRLAWCYGDMGVACMLLNVSNLTNDPNLRNRALEILRHNSSKRELKNNLVLDAGFCHGASGIAYMFQKAFNVSNEECFRDAALYWLDVCLKMATFPDGPAGFKACRRTVDSEVISFQDTPHLLEGIAGIGLTLISAISGIEPSWDELFLLS